MHPRCCCCCRRLHWLLLQVSAASLELLQHLASRTARSRELEELLLDGPAGVALLTHVGRRLGEQPALFSELAALLKVRGLMCCCCC